jgi:mannose-1-phosphate guanylyltransferase
MKTATGQGYFSSLWGIVLAAGDGKRVEPMVHSLRGDTLPKQFVDFAGTRSMLQHTFDRAEKLVSRERLLVVVNRDHLKYPEVRQQLAGRAKDTVIVQPQNKDTLPGLLLPLLHIYRRDPLATVAVFPADQFILPEDRFVKYVFLACRTVEREPSRLVLLGVEPDRPENEYGYILPGEEPNALRGFGPRRVSSFIEKPSPEELRALLESGALWNMMVLVFKAFTVFDLTARLAPELHARFERLGAAIGTRAERRAVTDAYREIEPLNFSTGLLERLPKAAPNSLLTIPLEGVLWNDLGAPRRLASVLAMADSLLGQDKDVTGAPLWANRKKISRPTSRTKSDRITLQMR